MLRELTDRNARVSLMSARAVSHFYSAADGLRLHVRDYPPIRDDWRTPAVCLPGLTRGAGDFERLACALSESSETPRRVLCFDYRGRGLSDHDADWRRYNLATERTDFVGWLAENGIAAAHFIGTSRGGLHIMGLATVARSLIRAVVLNDIGPVLEPEGLLRIKGYVGVPSTPLSLKDAIAVLKRGPAAMFTGLSDDEWAYFATTTFGSEAKDLRFRYDPKLARALDDFDLTKPLPAMWEQFDALKGSPVLTIRGANPDLLSGKTLQAMGARWRTSEIVTVPGQGHAPLLADMPTISRIDHFLAAADRVGSAYSL